MASSLFLGAGGSGIFPVSVFQQTRQLLVSLLATHLHQRDSGLHKQRSGLFINIF